MGCASVANLVQPFVGTDCVDLVQPFVGTDRFDTSLALTLSLTSSSLAHALNHRPT